VPIYKTFFRCFNRSSLGWLLTATLALSSLVSPSFAVATTEEYAIQAAALINNIRSKLDNCSSSGMLGASAIKPSDSMATQVSLDRRSVASSRPNLVWNPQLAQAALRHSKAMADDFFFDHTDMKGRAVNHRVQDQGYRFRVVGENIAAGQASLEEAIRDWLLSAGHCTNMIDERFTEFGIAKVGSTRADDPYGVYWTLVLGQPRDGLVARR
jgi:Cysteine-rich secretory protein family